MGDYEYDIETTQLGVAFKDIVFPEGAELWDYEDIKALYNDEKKRKELGLEKCWFFVGSGLISYSVVEFDSYSNRVKFSHYRDTQDQNSGLGVRFKYKINKCDLGK
jgi:hypothetical protein